MVIIKCLTCIFYIAGPQTKGVVSGKKVKKPCPKQLKR